MNSEKIKIGVISPSKFFIKTAKNVAMKLEPQVRLKTANAARFEAIPIGQQMEAEGVEVIVSRHGTARELRLNLNIPVLSVPLTSFQLFQHIQKASELGHRILVLTYHDYIEGIKQLEEIFGVKIIHVNRNKQEFEDIENCILYGINQGCQVVMGGKVTTTIAKSHGLQALEIPVSATALKETLLDACSVANSRRKELELNQRYRTIIDTISEGIIAVDKEGHVTTVNQVAKSILSIGEEDSAGLHIDSYLKKSPILKAMQSGQSMRNQLETIGDDQYLVDHVPVLKDRKVLGGIITIQKVSEVQVAEHELRRSLTRRLVARYTIEDFFGKTKTSRQLIDKVKKFALHDTTILISGETGTGKEIIVQGIHNLSKRRTGPFVSINCGAIPETLLESELFGYDEGAFTGSLRGGKAGLFELAHNGTIFLDEIGDAPQSVQSRLLRVLQEKEVMRIGGDRLIPVDVRIISATNKNLAQEVGKGFFREDLYFRLNILNLHIPPLSERINELPLLAVKIIERKARENQLALLKLPGYCLDRLAGLSWPGNVRQLSNFIERLLILSEGTFSKAIFDELYDEMKQYQIAKGLTTEITNKQNVGLKAKARENEGELIVRILEEEDFIKKRAAKRLGISRGTLWRKMKNLNIS